MVRLQPNEDLKSQRAQRWAVRHQCYLACNFHTKQKQRRRWKNSTGSRRRKSRPVDLAEVYRKITERHCTTELLQLEHNRFSIVSALFRRLVKLSYCCIFARRNKREVHPKMARHTGDSGGPLMLEDGGRWTLVGIVSAGFSCAQPGQPGIYHRVSATTDWISSVAWS
ncbi:hypothetical protein QYM36_009623 [Artemia franciscana]|uniref:Peptidase S1 domain-containing protein n=1 Tax=Artemia franciscana TaxID=6661 RepID=A0AA88HU06_ARTSF|nr:hypothetical protein QYM36_009623 [Artemia franciscana]